MNNLNENNYENNAESSMVKNTYFEAMRFVNDFHTKLWPYGYGIDKYSTTNALISDNPEENLEALLISYSLPEISYKEISRIKQKIQAENKELLDRSKNQ